MTQEDLFQAVKMFGSSARINCENHITIRNCVDNGDLLTIRINGEVDSDVLTQLSFLVHCLREAQNMQPCPKCGEKQSRIGKIGTTPEGTPIASMYAELYHCSSCLEGWYYTPYAQ